MKYLAVICALVIALSGSIAAKINGAVVQTVTIDKNVASITVLNQSDQDLTGFTLAITGTFPDGRKENSEFTEDYGPLTGSVLGAQQIAIEPYTYKDAPIKVAAKVIVALYKDGTAEADDEATLDQVVSVRAGMGKALQLGADTLNAALSTTSPSDYARLRFKELLASDDKTVDRAYLKGSVQLVEAAPKGGERQFFQQQAARHQREATAFAAYAKIRRLP
jgi:hypothetical protein